MHAKSDKRTNEAGEWRKKKQQQHGILRKNRVTKSSLAQIVHNECVSEPMKYRWNTEARRLLLFLYVFSLARRVIVVVVVVVCVYFTSLLLVCSLVGHLKCGAHYIQRGYHAVTSCIHFSSTWTQAAWLEASMKCINKTETRTIRFDRHSNSPRKRNTHSPARQHCWQKWIA